MVGQVVKLLTKLHVHHGRCWLCQEPLGDPQGDKFHIREGCVRPPAPPVPLGAACIPQVPGAAKLGSSNLLSCPAQRHGQPDPRVPHSPCVPWRGAVCAGPGVESLPAGRG